MKFVLVAPLVLFALSTLPTSHSDRLRIWDSDTDSRITVSCNPGVVGARGCQINPFTGFYEKALYNDDFPIDSAIISPPADGTPYGVHITVDKSGYIFSWQVGTAHIGPTETVPEPSQQGFLYIGSRTGLYTTTFSGDCVQFLRAHTDPTAARYNYLSPFLCHVRTTKLPKLRGSPGYFYLYGDGTRNSTERFLRVGSGIAGKPKRPAVAIPFQHPHPWAAVPHWPLSCRRIWRCVQRGCVPEPPIDRCAGAGGDAYPFKIAAVADLGQVDA